jgi:hypothetical protein
MRAKPNIQDFLNAGNTAEQPANTAPTQASKSRINKTLRLSQDVEAALKEQAYQRTKASGQRVTESDIVDEALRQYLGI